MINICSVVKAKATHEGLSSAEFCSAGVNAV